MEYNAVKAEQDVLWWKILDFIYLLTYTQYNFVFHH